MAKSDELLDRVFKEKLENHETSPRPAAWDKLEAQLDAAEQPKKRTWWAIAAAIPLILGLGYLIWSQVPKASQESPLAVTEEELIIPPAPESTREAEKVSSKAAQKPAYLAETSSPSSSKPALKSSLPQVNTRAVNSENVVVKAVTFPSLQTAVEQEVNYTTESKTLLTAEPIRITTTPSTPQPTLANGEDLDGYRIRIFSDGLKKEAAPNKNLITELGKTVGQVEGFLDKLDEGFVEIQDKKERLFSSLIGRKAPSTEKK